MAEFAATGTAVGIISLGIQTCQILHNYYSKYKSHGADIHNVLDQVQALQGSLESLHNVKNRFRIEDAESSSHLQQALKVCQEALNELKVIADKCATQQPRTIQARMKNVKKRILWPFRKEVLESLQTTLSRAQNHLSFILQIAGIDVVSHKIDDIHPVLNTIGQQGASMNQSMVQTTSSLQTLQLNVQEVSKAQNQYATLLVSERTELQNFIAGQIATLTPMINLLVSCIQHLQSKYSILTSVQVRSDGAIRDPTTTPPSVIAEATQSLQNVGPQIQTTLDTLTTSVIANPASACHCRRKTRRVTKRIGWAPVFYEESFSHNKDCPYFPSSDYSKSVAVQFTMYTRFVGFCVQAGWRKSKEGGWKTPIAPVLRYCAVVSDDSPAFKLLAETTKTVRELGYQKTPSAELSNILKTTGFELKCSFGKNASPTDLDKNGRSIFMVFRLSAPDVHIADFTGRYWTA
jgi:hypothetical protein